MFCISTATLDVHLLVVTSTAVHVGSVLLDHPSGGGLGLALIVTAVDHFHHHFLLDQKTCAMFRFSAYSNV